MTIFTLYIKSGLVRNKGPLCHQCQFSLFNSVFNFCGTTFFSRVFNFAAKCLNFACPPLFQAWYAECAGWCFSTSIIFITRFYIKKHWFEQGVHLRWNEFFTYNCSREENRNKNERAFVVTSELLGLQQAPLKFKTEIFTIFSCIFVQSPEKKKTGKTFAWKPSLFSVFSFIFTEIEN